MKMTQTLALLAAVVATASAAQASTKTEWNFYMEANSIGTTSMAAFFPGYKQSRAQLFQDTNGAYTFRLQGPSVDLCFSQEMDATVEKTSTELIITPAPKMRNCPQIRLVINSNGSGGVVQQNIGKRGAIVWQTDEDHNYDLTPR